MSEEECAICFTQSKPYKSSWICGHSFCQECTTEWDGTCPICRCDRIFTPIPPRKASWNCFSCISPVVPIRHYVNLPKRHLPVTPEHYFTKWEKKVCIEEHRIRFDHRNGDIFATCELCGTKQAFPYMG